MVNVERTLVQELPTDEPLGALEPVAYFNGAMPTGVTVSHKGRIFVNFPKWGDDVSFTVAEIRKGETVAYPDESINQTNPADQAAALVSVQSVVVDPVDRLWILDTGSPLFQPTKYGGPKLVCVDLKTDQVSKKILFHKTWPCQLLILTIYVLIYGAVARAWHSSQTQHKRGPMGSSSWTWHPSKAGADCMIIPL
jgi:hypothetical protein